MANVFAEKVQKFMPLLDEIYKAESKTAMLENTAVQWVGTNKIRLPKMSMDGAADYDRENGYVRGAVNISYGDYELEFDRGRSFQIDYVDNDEAGFDAFRTLMQEYVRTKEIPEFDAVRITRLAARADADNVKELDTISSYLDEWEAARIQLTNKQVASSNRIAFVTPEFLSGLKGELRSSGRFDIQKNTSRFNFVVEEIDNVPLIEIPSPRMYDVVTLLDGETTGEEGGGFEPEVTVSKGLHMIYGDFGAMKNAFMKRKASKTFTPETNPFADAYLVQYRNHHDLVVQDNKRKGIYVLKKATAIT